MSAFLSHMYSSMTSLPLSLPPLPFTLRPVTLRTLEIKSKYLTPFLFFITPWGLFVSFLSECQASAWVSKQTSSSRNDVSENCHWLGMSCQLLCRANDYCWVLWELKVSNSGHCFFFSPIAAMVLLMRVLLDAHCLDSCFFCRFVGQNPSSVVVCEVHEHVLHSDNWVHNW